jgi:hypothetical protein
MRRALVAVAGIAAAGALLAGGSRSAASVRIECHFGHRGSVTKRLETGPILRLSIRRRTVTARVGQFGVRLTTSPSFDAGEPESLSVRIWSRRDGKAATSGLYQFGPRRPLNQFDGGHGFTGLVYAYLPTGAELQYFCRSV